MKQIDRYNILEQFHKEAHQVIYMAIDQEKEHEVALVNTVDRNTVLSDDAFNELVRHLSNVSYYDISDKLILVTNYNAGIPIITYLHNYHTDEEARLNLLSECLKKCCDYETLPMVFQSILIDAHQIVIYQKQVFFNEVILLRDLQTAVDFHTKILALSQLIIGNATGVMSKHALSFFNSTAFFSNPSIKNIYSQFHRLRSGDTMVLVDPQPHDHTHHPVEAPIPISLADQGDEDFIQLVLDEPIQLEQPEFIHPEQPEFIHPEQPEFIQPEMTEYNQLNLEELPIVSPTPIPAPTPIPTPTPTPTPEVILPPTQVISSNQPSELHIGLTEKRSDAKPPKTKKEWRFPWLLLILVAMFTFGWWYIFIYEDLPNPPVASYQMITTEKGWQFTSSSIAYAPATLKSYEWTVILNGELIETHQTEYFLMTPTKSGDYIISLSVTDSFKQKSQGFSNTLRFDAKDAIPEDTSSDDLPELPDSYTPGEILEDLKIFQSSPSSQRISIPSSQLYGIASKKGIAVSKGDLMSIWLKTSDLKPVSVLLIGYKDGVKSYETHWTYKPSIADFELVSHTFEVSNIEQVDIFIQSDNVYVWFDAFNIETIK